MLRPGAGLEGERITMDEITAYWQDALGKTSVLGHDRCDLPHLERGFIDFVRD